MTLRILHVAAAVALVSCSTTQRPTGLSDPTSEAAQLLVVTTASWEAADARLSLYERQQGTWRARMTDVPAVVGKNGLAWGRGIPLDLQAGADTPAKREGDGKAPAGLFALGTAFGFDEQPRAASMPYRRLTPETECVDDSRSAHYNALVERAAVAVDWTSSEKMLEVPLYRIGAVVLHNAPEAVPEAGSCIFLHVWREPGRGTAGCTAMEEARLAELLAALDGAKRPMLLQLPQAVYEAARARYALP